MAMYWDIEAEGFLREFTEKTKPLVMDTIGTQWEVWNGKGDRKRLDKLEMEEASVYSDKKTFDRIKELKDNVTDKKVWRQLDILYRFFLGYQVEKGQLDEMIGLTNKINGVYSSSRPEYGGQETTLRKLKEVLRDEKDPSKRKAAWVAMNSIGDKMAEGGFRELLKIRNGIAKQQGFNTYYEMQLYIAGIDKDWLYGLMGDLEKLTEKPYVEFHEKRKGDLAKALGIPKESLQTWDFDFDIGGWEKEIDEYFPKRKQFSILMATMKGMGIELERLPITYDREEREGKNPHAFTFSIDPPRDMRIMMTPYDRKSSMATHLHETGHGIHGAGKAPDSPWIFYGAYASHADEVEGAAMAEGIAFLFDGIASDPEWLRVYGGMPRDLIEKVQKALPILKTESLRRKLAFIDFERFAYEDPDQDLNELWFGLRERYLGLPTPHEKHAQFAMVPHYTSSPGYFQNYLLADLIAAQLRHTLKNDLMDNPTVIKFLKEKIFSKGISEPLDDIIKGATGEGLDPDYFSEEIIT